MFRSVLTLLFLVPTFGAPAPPACAAPAHHDPPSPARSPPPPPPPVRYAQSPRECSISIAGSTITGTKTPAGACRYSIKYASVDQRWGLSRLVSDFPATAAGSLPPQCPQRTGSYVDSGNPSEDCLYAVVYTPSNLPPRSSLPVFTWLHGGSFIEGGASAPGLDGSSLAVRGNIIVIFLQCRLGVLGLLPPPSAPSASDSNLSMLDVINGLTAISQYVQYLGGDPRKVTLGGQSSGAGMIRALLGAPAARGLFRAAILQSDPMIYGFASQATTGQLQAAYYAQPALASCTTLQCLQALPVGTLLDAQMDLITSAPYSIPGIPTAEVLRPTHGTISLPYDPTSLLWSNPNGLAIHPADLPLLLTTTANEAGTVVQSLFPGAIPQSNEVLGFLLSQLIGSDRATQLLSSASYALSAFGGGDGFRERLERIITDGVWRCSNRDAASRWAAAGGSVYVGEWRQGVSYPSNQGGGYCQGKVCHEDDIYPTFSTAPNPSAAVTAFENEVLTRWVAFITNLDPNAPRTLRDRWTAFLHWWKPRVSRAISSKWEKYTGNGESGVFALGGDGHVTTCPAGLWGQAVQYDWQIYQ